jgi:hypothetical protein
MKFRPAIVLAVAALGVLTGVAGADPPMTKTEAKQLARSLVLTSADMPGYTSLRHLEPREADKVTDRWIKCAGAVPRKTALAMVNSRDFAPPDQITSVDGANVSSAAIVQPTAALARRDLAAGDSSRGRKCTRKYGVSPPDSGIQQVLIKNLPAPAPGVEHQRVTLRERDFSGHTDRYYFDSLVFRRGRVEVAMATATADETFPAAEELRILNILLARAQQQIP